MKDLAFYYDETRSLPPRGVAPGTASNQRARRVLQQDLRDALAGHKNEEIMLISHSMGTIIAYDVLRDVNRETDPRFAGLSVPHFVTIGSPLGLPHVRARIMDERNYEKKRRRSTKDVRTPTVVTETWVNFADKKDPVALDVHLGDDYAPNAAGMQVRDDLVRNDYRRPRIRVEDGGTVVSRDPNGKRNPHKSYGYLRAPELAEHVAKFLSA